LVPASLKGDQLHTKKSTVGATDRKLGNQTMGKKGGIANHALNFQLEEHILQDNIRKAYKSFQLLKKDPDRWDTWIAGIIQAQALAKGVPTKALWKQHRAAERARKMARRVRLVLQSSNRHGALQAVTGPTPEGYRKEFTTKSSLEKACIEEAGRRFTQANNTPMLQTDMIQRFGEIGANRPELKNVLAGKSQPLPTDDTYTTKLLQHLSRPPNITKLPPRSLQEYNMGWRKSQETTASSMSGIHFGHYMAGTFNPEIAIFNATMADLPMRTGYSPQRWREGLNVMLEKTPGNFNVEKLRIILLFEADFNANNKWIG